MTTADRDRIIRLCEKVDVEKSAEEIEVMDQEVQEVVMKLGHRIDLIKRQEEVADVDEVVAAVADVVERVTARAKSAKNLSIKLQRDHLNLRTKKEKLLTKTKLSC